MDARIKKSVNEALVKIAPDLQVRVMWCLIIAVSGTRAG